MKNSSKTENDNIVIEAAQETLEWATKWLPVYLFFIKMIFFVFTIALIINGSWFIQKRFNITAIELWGTIYFIHVVLCLWFSDGITKVKTEGEDVEETYNMKICGNLEILDVKEQKEVKTKSKLSKSQELRLWIMNLADARNVVDTEEFYNAYMDKIINTIKERTEYYAKNNKI